MAADPDRDTKVVIQTYLPEHQRDEWDAHADELEMSRSEFIKAMVQAGRRGFEGGTAPNSDPPEHDRDSEEFTARGSEETLEDTVLDALSAEQHLSWDELLSAVTDDIESRLEETLQQLQADDRIRYSGRHGGYTLDS